MKNIQLIFFLIFTLQIFAQPAMQATIKRSSVPAAVDIFMKSSAAFSRADENIIVTLAVPTTVMPAPSIGTSGTTPNGTGIIPNITGLVPDIRLNNIGSTQREVLVSKDFIKGVEHYVYTFIFQGTPLTVHDWEANVEQKILTIAFLGCTSECFNSMKLVSLPNGGSTGFSYWYFQANTLGGITNYAAPFYANPDASPPENGNAPDPTALSLIEIPNLVLPLKLLLFKATQNQCDVKVSWETAEESEFSYYSLERSEDKAPFHEVKRISGTTTGRHTYSFTDEGARLGMLEYRLKMVDNDAGFAYSVVRSINLNCSGKNGILVYPSLTHGNVNIKLPLGLENAKVIVVNSLGSYVTSDQKSGLNRNIDLSRFKNGTYFLQILPKNGSEAHVKVVLQK